MASVITMTKPAGRRVAWPIATWPRADQVAWAQAQRHGDFLDEPGSAADWRPATYRAAIGCYGRWLAFLHDHALLDFDQPPASRFTVASVRAYIAFLRPTCASTTLASYLGILGMMIQAMVPGQDWAWLWRVQSRLQGQASPSRNKRARIVPVEDLLRLGQDLMRQADTDITLSPVDAALTFRDGLLIALLALRPLRRKNVMAIELDRHLVTTGTGTLLRFDAGETKTHMALEVPFPAELHAGLARYLDHHRRVLLARRAGHGTGDTTPASHLWLTQYGEPFSGKSSVNSLDKHMLARFGHKVNMHLFRDCAATSVANQDPEHTRIGALILGHQSLQTTERHYILANSRAAAAGYHDLLASIRAEGPAQAPHAALPAATRRPDIRHDRLTAIPVHHRKD